MTDPSVNTGKVFKKLVAEDKVNAYRIDTLRVVQKTLRKIVVNIAAETIFKRSISLAYFA